MKGLKPRIALMFFTVFIGLYFLVPSYIKFHLKKPIPKIVKAGDPWYFHLIPSQTLKLGLDLTGGLHLVLGIDFEEVFRDAVAKVKTQLKEMADKEKLSNISFETTANNRILVKYDQLETWKKLDAEVSKFMSEQIDFDSQTDSSAVLRLSQEYEKTVKRRAIDQTLETLRNRIDEFGISEPSIQPQGEEKILLQFPEEQESTRLKEIIARTAKLTFQIVKTGPEMGGENPSMNDLQKWVTDFETAKKVKLDAKTPMSKYLKEINAYLADKLPKDTEILFKKETNINTKEATYVPYLLEKAVMVSGEDLEDAFYSFNPQTSNPEVNFHLNSMGTQKFDKATSDNVGKFMAIVLDSNVHSAPRIKERIPSGRAMINMDGSGKSQQDMMNEAKDTSLVLRSGALPARVEFLEERIVGPSLGADAIRAGTSSLAFGLLLVFIFMVIYYRMSGAVASFALFLNGLFVFSLLAAFEGTLTLPGLAGITLTLGMAVDANVLIFEHMREELRAGKTVVLAITEGYRRAFSAIIDSHSTTIIGALVLLQFGYGPIRGFAVTLLMGLVASLYTSVFITRVAFDYFIIAKGKTRISV